MAALPDLVSAVGFSSAVNGLARPALMLRQLRALSACVDPGLNRRK